MEHEIKGGWTEKNGGDEERQSQDCEDGEKGSFAHSRYSAHRLGHYFFGHQFFGHYLETTCSAWSACKACTRTSPRCRAEIPSAAARAAESVVIVVMRPVTAARRMAFSSK